MINFYLRKKLAFAVLMIVGTMSYANALVLDTFDYNVDIENGAVATPVSTTVYDFNIFLGDAEYTLNSLVNGKESSASTVDFFNVNNGSLNLANNPSASSTLEIFYGQLGDLGNPGYVPVPVDFTLGGDYFYFDVESIDLSFDVTLTVFNGNKVAAATLMKSYDSSAVGTQLLSFNDAAWVGAADYTAVTGVLLSITGSGNSDLTISEFGIVPEPTTLAIFGLGLLGLGLSRRRQA